jgi:hypothetical protein
MDYFGTWNNTVRKILSYWETQANAVVVGHNFSLFTQESLKLGPKNGYFVCNVKKAKLTGLSGSAK